MSKVYAFFASLLLIIFTFAVFSTPTFAATPQKIKAATLMPHNSMDFASPEFKQTLDRMKAANIDQVTLILLLQQDYITSNQIYYNYNHPTDYALDEAIKYAKSIGLKVAFRPHVDPNYDYESRAYWRGNIDPTDKALWFANYQRIYDKYIDIANKYGVSEISVGTELMAMTDTNKTPVSYWKNFIAHVRSRYNGILTYSALFGEESQVQFWDDLDYIGISAYWPLSGEPDPSVDKVKESWAYINSSVIQPISTHWGKPVSFTEMGYRSVKGANMAPWGGAPFGNVVDIQEQTNLYEGTLAYWQNQPNFLGHTIWGWEPNPNYGGLNDSTFSPQNKPAEQIIKKYFAPASAYNQNPQNIPGKVELENYDLGGEGSSYHDFDPINQGGNCRQEGVDLIPSYEDSGCALGYTLTNEWINYSINVQEDGEYLINSRVSSAGNGGKFNVEIDGLNATGTMIVPNTNGWWNWQTITPTNKSIYLKKGTHILTLRLNELGETGWVGNFNYLEIIKKSEPNLISYWNFNDPDNQLRDTKGQNNGQITGTSIDQGILESSRKFSSPSEIGRVPPSPSLNLNNFSISTWVYPTQIKGTWQPILIKENDGDGLNTRNYGLFIRPNSTLVHYSFSRTNNTWASFDGGTQLTLNKWNHIVLSYNGSQFKLFVNGKLDISTPETSIPVQLNNSLKFGNEVGAYTNFSGSIDETGLWDGPLSENYINFLYNEGRANNPISNSPSTPIPTSLIFDETYNLDWQNWSWDADVQSTTEQAFTGFHSLKLNTIKPWGGLRLHTNVGINTSQYNALTLTLKGTNTGQNYGIALVEGGYVNLADYGGAPQPNQWKTYVIPLADLRAYNRIIHDLYMQDWSGKENASNIDKIAFVKLDNLTLPINNSSCISINAPSTLIPGQKFSASITVKNTGTKKWSSDATPHSLGAFNPIDNWTWRIPRIVLPNDVAPNEQVTFNFESTAPLELGTYNFSWAMVEDYIEWFGQSCDKPISVVKPTNSLIYEDLLTNWQNWSWDTTLENITNPIFSGTSALKITHLKEWAGLRLHNDQGINTQGYNALRFALYGPIDQKDFGLTVVGENSQLSDNYLSKYNPTPIANQWNIYTIPLEDINALNKTIKDFIFQDRSGKKSTYNLDKIELVNLDILPTPVPTPSPTPISTPTPTPSPTSTPTPTPTPTSTPTPSPLATNFPAKYWNIDPISSPEFPTSTPNLTREDSTINFIWNHNSPDPLINPDHFAVEWTKTTNFEEGDYKFTTESDDGIRVFIDGELVIDDWKDHAKTTNSVTKHLSAGNHDIKIQYYEYDGGAIVTFNYSKL